MTSLMIHTDRVTAKSSGKGELHRRQPPPPRFLDLQTLFQRCGGEKGERAPLAQEQHGVGAGVGFENPARTSGAGDEQGGAQEVGDGAGGRDGGGGDDVGLGRAPVFGSTMCPGFSAWLEVET
jgi:hypothetical protein